MKIKTIARGNTFDFDREVNTHLAKGWDVHKFGVEKDEQGRIVMLAVMTKSDTATETEPACPVAEPAGYEADIRRMEASVRSLSNACKHIADCHNCQVMAWCTNHLRVANRPCAWRVDG